MNAIYNKIGQGYNTHRAADKRIVNLIRNNLKQSPRSIIAEIGAGTCNYAIELCKQNYLVKAIEPSEIMREQVRMVSNLELINGFAEKIP